MSLERSKTGLGVGEHRLNPVVVFMGVHVYQDETGKWVVDRKDLNTKVRKALKSKGLITDGG